MRTDAEALSSGEKEGATRGASPVGTDTPSGRTVIDIDPISDPRWTAFVDGRAGASIYHHAAWFTVLQRSYGYRSAALACQTPDGGLVGILPLLDRRGLLTGRQTASLPHTPVAGPLGVDPDAERALARTAVQRLVGRRRAWLQLKTEARTLDGAVEGLTGSDRDMTYVLRLPDQPDQLRFGNSRNHSRIKWAVGKSQRSDVRIREAENLTDLRRWYGLYLETMRWHAVPPRPYRFFEALWEVLRTKEMMQLLLAERGGGRDAQLLAGSLFLAYGTTVSYAFNGRRRDSLHLRPNDAIHWHAIHEACRRGFRRYDFGEVSSEQHSLAEFKGKWGAEPEQLYRYHYPSAKEIEKGALREDGRIRLLASRVWRRLPLRATAALGDWMYERL
jgi:CelD/BcsL family acetyltransferase involved in cellulose biosynthesis